MALKREDVIRTAEVLHKRGEAPTQEAVRKALGGGSYSTIGAGLREWHEKQSQKRSGQAKGFTLDLEKIINIEAIMAAAKAHAQAEFSAERSANKVRVESLERELAAANSKLDDMEELVTLAQADADVAKARVVESEKLAAVLQSRIEYMQENDSALNQRLSEMMELKTEAVIGLKALEKEKIRLKEQMFSMMDKNEELGKDLAAADRKLAASAEAVKVLKEQLAEQKAKGE
ncbi:DNA-binding protein [Oryzomonas rubra]|uniref:DNA-binding protein n=1 Tax=Oryzomonas rubra TaxID=2509454 RepID=A0A5A9XNR7_9BACT|nr:DNA-binding protein [Oryzomonas rubra]KAA0894233.1 DNA-binding protein [Oryzomonas rubra]